MAAPIPAGEEPVEIRGRGRQLQFPEIEQKLRVCPTAEQFRDVGTGRAMLFRKLLPHHGGIAGALSYRGACSSFWADESYPPMHAQGFILQPADLDAILVASQELTEGLVFADPGYTPDQNLDMLVRTIRMLQVGMGMQLTENAELTDEFNKLQEDFTVRAGGRRQKRYVGAKSVGFCHSALMGAKG